MRNFFKKINFSLLCLAFVLNVSVYGNMTLEAMNEADEFNRENSSIINLISNIADIMKILILLLIVIMPVIFIYKKIKLRNGDNNENKKINNLFLASEILAIISYIIIRITEIIKSTASVTIYADCFIIFIVVLSIGIILYKNFKKIN